MSPIYNSNINGYVLNSSYDPELLIISVLIALVSSCIAIIISNKAITETSGQWKKNLLFGSAIVQGLGLWSMHFIGMLALQLEVAINYNLPTTLPSLLLSLLAGYIIVNTGNHSQYSITNLLSRSLLISSAIGLMHFTGISSMSSKALIYFDITTLALTAALTFSLTLLAVKLKIIAITCRLKQQPSMWILYAPGITMGLVIISAHYISMAGTIFYITDLSILDSDYDINNHHSIIVSMVGMAMVASMAILFMAMRFSHRMEMLSQIEDHDRYLSAIIDNTIEGIIVIDKDGLINTFNSAAEHIFGYTAMEVIGKDVSLLLPEDEQQEHKQYTKNSTLHAPRIINRGRDLEGRRKDGSLFPLELNIAPLKIKDSKGFIGLARDVSKRKQTETALQQSEERFRRSQIFANIGTWDWNIQSGELYWSERIGPLFGYPDGKLETTYENFINAVHPDDRQKVMDAVNNCVEYNADYEIEHRVVWPDGQIRWAHERGDVTRADDGTPLHMLGVVIDISDRKYLEETLSNQQMLLNLLRQGMIDYVSNDKLSDMADKLLTGLLGLTGSEYGFTGEVVYNDDDTPYLKTHAISNIAWNDQTRRFYDDNAPEGLEFTNIDTLFGAVLKTGEVVIANDAPHDSRRGGLPEGHPPLNTFLGVPIYYGNEMVGMYGLANRVGGYTNELLEFLRPFDTTYGVIIHALRMAQTEQQNLLDIKQAKDEAEKASQAKSEFLSRMSHELRTPMNAILGFTQIMQLDGDQVLQESYNDSLNEIMHAGKHLLELINDVLDLSQIETGHMEISIEPVAVGKVFTACHNLIAPLASEHELTITFDHPDDQPVLADQTRLKQIMINLLSNAVKYNKKNGHIRVRSECINGKMKITVTDTGIGIPEDRQAELFTAFNRIDADNSGIEGTGIGLVITRNLVEKMGGEIGFTSDKQQGTTFWIELPLASPSSSLITPSTSNNVNSAEKSLSETHAFNILYIEDNSANIKLIQLALKQQNGIKLMSAETAEQGLELINKDDFDLILLDINLPGMSGYDLLNIIRNNPDTRSLTVFGISANAMPADIERAIQAGFNQYITKPVDLKQLAIEINKLR